jgi:hypothetical protein
MLSSVKYISWAKVTHSEMLDHVKKWAEYVRRWELKMPTYLFTPQIHSTNNQNQYIQKICRPFFAQSLVADICEITN